MTISDGATTANAGRRSKPEAVTLARRRRVWDLLLVRKTEKEIAALLGCSLRTVERDAKALRERMEARLSGFELQREFAVALASLTRIREMAMNGARAARIGSLDYAANLRLGLDTLRQELLLLERFGFLRPLDATGMPDISEFDGKPPEIVAQEMAFIFKQVRRRLYPETYAAEIAALEAGASPSMRRLTAAQGSSPSPTDAAKTAGDS